MYHGPCREITAELAKLEANLKKLHGKVAGKYDEVCRDGGVIGLAHIISLEG